MRLITTQRTARSSRTEQPVGVRLIVLEDGAFAFEPPEPSSDAPLEVAVLVQSAGERPAELAARAIRRLSQLERSDRVVREAVIAAGPSSGAEVLESRAALARAILKHIVERGVGEIALAAGSEARPELRHELLSLAESLTAQPNSPGVSVRVLFGPRRSEPERRSGVHASPSTVSARAIAALSG